MAHRSEAGDLLATTPSDASASGGGRILNRAPANERLIRCPHFPFRQKSEGCDMPAAGYCDAAAQVGSSTMPYGRKSSSELHSIGARLQLLRTLPMTMTQQRCRCVRAWSRSMLSTPTLSFLRGVKRRASNERAASRHDAQMAAADRRKRGGDQGRLCGKSSQPSSADI